MCNIYVMLYEPHVHVRLRFTVGLVKCISQQHSVVTPHSWTLVMVRLPRRARKSVGLVTIAAHIGLTRMCYEPLTPKLTGYTFGRNDIYLVKSK